MPKKYAVRIEYIEYSGRDFYLSNEAMISVARLVILLYFYGLDPGILPSMYEAAIEQQYVAAGETPDQAHREMVWLDQCFASYEVPADKRAAMTLKEARRILSNWRSRTVEIHHLALEADKLLAKAWAKHKRKLRSVSGAVSVDPIRIALRRLLPVLPSQRAVSGIGTQPSASR